MVSKEKIFNRSFDYFVSIISQRILNSIIHIVKHPIFIFYLGAGVYGDWLLLLSIPSFLSLYELGFGTAGINKISMSFAKKNFDECRRVFITIFILLIIFGIILFLTSLAILSNISTFDNYFDYIENDIIKIYILILVLYLIVGNISGFFNTLLHTANFYALSVYYKNLFILIEFIVSVLVLILTKNLMLILMSILIIRIIRLFFMILVVNSKIKWLSFKITLFTYSKIKELIIPSLTFLFPPIIFILKNQALFYLIAYYYDSQFVTLFVLTLTMTRIIFPIGNLMNDAIKIEINQLFINKNFNKMLKIYFLNIQLIFWILIFLFIPIYLFSSYFFEIWTLSEVKFNYNLFTFLFIGTFFATLTGPLQLFLYGTNLHSKYVTTNLILTLLNFIFLIFFLEIKALNYIAYSLLILEILTLFSVLIFTSIALNKPLFYFFINISKAPDFKELFLLGRDSILQKKFVLNFLNRFITKKK